ncbi:MAG: uroporphyrinogen decarboxylase family protein [Spirochaetia bacterium]|jgi:uroporphyrinogen decarboxylase
MADKTLAAIAHAAYDERRRLVAPLAGFPGVEMIGSTIKIAQQNFGEHYKALRSLVDAFHPDLVFPLMDLSVEANALGRYTVFPREESATVPKDRFQLEDLDRLAEINITFDSRLMGFVETLRMMSVSLPAGMLKGAYVVGPFTLAGLMMGADDTVISTMLDPAGLHRLCHFTTERIQEYIQLLLAAGADVICILEPTAVMLSPAQFSEFSAIYIRHIITSFKYSRASFVYHTCGNTMHLVEKMAAAGVQGVSLDSRDAGVDLPAAAARIPEDVVVIGNISPATTMRFGTPEVVRAEVDDLLRQMAQYPNFVLSTGCDLPQETPIANINAFMEAGRSWRR